MIKGPDGSTSAFSLDGKPRELHIELAAKAIEATGSFHRNMVKYDSFIIVMNLRGDCHIRIRSTQDSILLPEGRSSLIPASIADYDLVPTGSTTKVLEAFINNKKTIGKIISDFLHFS